MIRLESYGDRLEKGSYACHSRFRRAANFSRGGSLLALVDRSIGPGPRHVVVSGIEPAGIERLAVTNDGLWLDGRLLPLPPGRRYDSRLQPDVAGDRRRLRAGLQQLARCLRREAPERSLGFLLPGRQARAGRSALERAVARRLAAGQRLVFSRDLLRGVRMVRGTGFGLTPGGDDFVAGILLALHCGQAIFRRSYRRAIGAVRRNAIGGNAIANAMLEDAAAGRAGPAVKGLLAALCGGDCAGVARGVRRLRRLGHSSGIDLGVGLQLALARLEAAGGEPWW